jgi:uncharacterized membrane protein
MGLLFLSPSCFSKHSMYDHFSPRLYSQKLNAMVPMHRSDQVEIAIVTRHASDGGAEGFSRASTDKFRAERPGYLNATTLVFICTILGAAAQILMKFGANQLGSAGFSAAIHNMPLLGGYCAYGLSTVLLVLALRDGELSRLYPVTALTYVWVTMLSVAIFHDQLNVFKLAGVAVIVLGVVVLGRGGQR